MPSYPQWAQLARKVVAGTASDDVVRSFKLHNAVLEKLPLDFDREAYEKASRAYKAVSSSSKGETQQQAKNTYIAEKRKVLIALANTGTKKVVKSLEAAQCDNPQDVSQDFCNPSMAMSVPGGASLAPEEDNGGTEQIFLDRAQPQRHELPLLMPSLSSCGPALPSPDTDVCKKQFGGRTRKRPASAHTKLKPQLKKTKACPDSSDDVD